MSFVLWFFGVCGLLFLVFPALDREPNSTQSTLILCKTRLDVLLVLQAA